MTGRALLIPLARAGLRSTAIAGGPVTGIATAPQYS
jgi:hypothetical protein